MLPVDEIKSRLSMSEVLRQYGIETDRTGFCKCPLHTEKTGSMKVYKDSYYCFGCHQGGDVISFVRAYFGCDFNAAIARINDDFGLGLNLNTRKTMKDRAAEEKLIEAAQERTRRAELDRELESEAYNRYLDAFTYCDRVLMYGPEHPYYAWASNHIDLFYYDITKQREVIT